MATLTTTEEIIDALGGTAVVSRMTRRQMAQVARWKRVGKFPPRFTC